MFSPAAAAEGGPATATRSRRRQRPKSSESLVPPPKAKRQRLPLTEQTFAQPEAQAEPVESKPEPKPEARPAAVEAKGRDTPTEIFHPVMRRESTVRTKKSKHGDRAANKGDGSLVLVRLSYSYYTAAMKRLLTGLPQDKQQCLHRLKTACFARQDPTGLVGYVLPHRSSKRPRANVSCRQET